MHDRRTVGRDAIEQQISGVDNMNYMQSVNGNDGTIQADGQFRGRD